MIQCNIPQTLNVQQHGCLRLSLVKSESHHLNMAQTMGITNLTASHYLLLFYPQLLWMMSTSPKCMPLVKAAATSICGNGVGNIRKCTGMGSVNSTRKCGAGFSKELL